MITRRGLLISGVAAAAAGPPAFAEENTFNILATQGRFLPELRRRERAAAENRGAKGNLAQYLATIGDERAAYALLAELGILNAGIAEAPPDLTDARAESALAAIAREAKGRRFVVLNEAHYSSRSRAFGTAVARLLRAEGFDAFLAEAFLAQPPEDFDALTAPDQAVTGFYGGYVCDPAFAELVRQAREDGYRFGTYEWTQAQRPPAGADRAALVAAREQAQTENILAYLRRRPDARLLIFCGHTHVAEAPLGDLNWMAARLKAMTGEDPLTIDQTEGLSGPDQATTPSAVRAVEAAFKPVGPVVVRRPDGSAVTPTHYAGSVDLTVFQPLVADIDGRPGWLAQAPGRRRRVFRLPKLDDAPYLLAQAVPAGELGDPGALPSDQYRLRPGAKEAVFFLRPGRYEIRMETDAGRRVLGTL